MCTWRMEYDVAAAANEYVRCDVVSLRTMSHKGPTPKAPPTAPACTELEYSEYPDAPGIEVPTTGLASVMVICCIGIAAVFLRDRQK
jgi:hypothetical protein